MTTSQAITSTSPPIGTGIVSPDHLTPDGMTNYLESRLEALDEQANTIIGKQEASDTARKALQNVHNEMANVGEEGGSVNVAVYAKSLNDVAATMGDAAAGELREHLPNSLRDALVAKDGIYDEQTSDTVELSKQEAEGIKTYVESATKDLESGSELEMIQLQSVLSARNTAITLATNMMSAIGKGADAIVGNIGR